MPNFDSNDPTDFGWHVGPAGIVSFHYAGHDFPGGVAAGLVAVFTIALDRLTKVAGFELHAGSGLDDGDWGYEDRPVKGGTSKSFHAFGCALDLNSPWNPWMANPPADSPFRMPTSTSSLVESLGLLWGGGPRWGDHRDWMHIENHNTPAEAARYGIGPRPAPAPPGGAPPFPLPAGYYYGPWSGPAESISGHGASDGPYRPGLRVAQLHLSVPADGLYGPITATATRHFQTLHHLVPDGLIGPKTWHALVT